MFEKRRPGMLIWSDASGASQTRPNQERPATELLFGETLAAQSPFIGVSGRDENYHSLALVRSFRAQLGGDAVDRVTASASFAERSGDYWLGAPKESLALVPGDFVEADVELFAHSGPTLPTLKPELERRYYGTEGPRILSVKIGEKQSDFPATVRARDEIAQFTIGGGFDFVPLIVEGFRERSVPLLWKDGVWQDQQMRGGDGYQVEPDGHGGYRFVFVYPIRTGQQHTFTVTRAQCSTGIARIRDLNGDVQLEAPAVGTFTLKAPELFSPGTNVIKASEPIVTFTNNALSVRSIPISAQVREGTARVEILAYEGSLIRLKTQGDPLELILHGPGPNETVSALVSGQRQVLSPVSGRIILAIKAPQADVTIERTAR